MIMIISIPGVRGGRAVVAGTRIGVHDVVGLLQNGETVETLMADCFPELSMTQVEACLAYHAGHRAEIDQLVAAQRAEPTGFCDSQIDEARG